MTITKSVTFSSSFSNLYMILVIKGDDILIPYINSNMFKIEVCSVTFLETCTDMSFIQETISSTNLNLTIDTSSTYFIVNTTTFISEIDSFTINDVSFPSN